MRVHIVAAVIILLSVSSNRTHAISDPIEPFNRAMFVFNDFLPDSVVDPVADIAQAQLPLGVRQAASNMYLNVSEPEFITTNLLQGNFVDSFFRWNGCW